MNLKTLLTGLGICIAAVPAFGGDYSVSGTIKGHGGRILLLRPTSLESADTLANVVSPDGNFRFTGSVNTPIEARLEAVGTDIRIPLFLESGADITLSAATDSRVWTSAGGGELQQCRNRFNAIENEAAARRDSINSYYRSTYDLNDYFWVIQLKGALEREQNSFEKIEDDFLAANDNMVSASIVAQRLKTHKRNKTLHKKFALLGENAKASESGRMLQPLAETQSRISVGGIAPDFTMGTPDGGTLSLHGIKAKVKILDFWASWCGPCRAENPNVKKIYDAYHDKGLEILSVSLDTNKNLWLKAIEKDGMNWLHASDLKDGDTAKSLYNVYGIPYMLILDEDNRIISEGLRGEKLEEFIKSRFE